MSRRFISGQPRLLSAVLFTLACSLNSTTAAAQTVQNTTTRYEYDAMGNRTRITDPLGHVTTQRYDSLGRLVQQIQPAPGTGGASLTVSLSYDGQDQLSTVTDPRKLVTSYTVDGLGNQTALSSPDTGATGRTYDAAGNLKASTDARGKTTRYSYDALNRLTQISYASGTPTQFEYDGGATGAPNAIGHLTRMTDGSGHTTYAYDGFGRLLTKVHTIGSGTTAHSFAVSYSYGSSGNTVGKLTGMSYPSGNRISYSYDAAGRISSLTLNPTNLTGGGTNTGSSIPLLTGIGYQAFGPVNTWTWGNSSSTGGNTYARSIDLDGRITGYPLGHAASNGTVRSVSYDAASRISGTSHSGSGTGSNAPANFDQRYGYDNLDRLTGVTLSASATTQGYQYDANGNRTQAMFGGNAYANVIAAASNRLSATTGPAPAKHNLYDAAGHLMRDGTLSYSYNDAGRMASVTVGGHAVSYTYNGIGQRVQKHGPASIVASSSNRYVYGQAGRLLGEYDASGQVMQETVYLGELPVAVLKQTSTGSGSNRSIATHIYYIYADHLNTPRVITQASDNRMVWRWDHADPFGLQGPDDNPGGLGPFTYNPRFPGQLYDRESNTFYNYFRDYDPQLGRYLESDPIGLLGGLNTYSYVGGNPISYIDPFGLQIVIRGLGGAGAIGSAGGISTPGRGQGGYDPATDTYRPNSNIPSSGSPVAILCSVAPLACAARAIANEANQDNGKTCPVPGGTGGDRSNTGTRIWDKPGTFDDANRDFDNLQPGGVQDKGNGVRVGQLPNGDRVIVRPDSSDGNPTIEVQRPDGKRSRDKVRYR